MPTIFINKLFRWVMIFISLVFTGSASAYSLQDDPSSTWGTDDSTTITTNGTVFNYQDLVAQNLTSNTLSNLDFAISFIWPLVTDTNGSSYVSMPQWSNALDGWYTSDFNNTGVSLTIALTSVTVDNVLTPISSVALGDIEDITGTGQQLPLTEPCSTSPSCVPPSQPGQLAYPTETRLASDLVPEFSLGSFAANETKHFDLAFTYTFGDGSGNVLPTGFAGNTLSDVSTASPSLDQGTTVVPLPAAFWLFSSTLVGLIGINRRKCK